MPLNIVFDLASLCDISTDTEDDLRVAAQYLGNVVQKLLIVELASLNDQILKPLKEAASWQSMSLENRSLYLYRHLKNRILDNSLDPEIVTERNIREAEKSIRRVLHGEWVDYDDFVRGVLVTLSEHSIIQLKRRGKHWKYVLPTYSESEKKFLKATIFEWLFEMGIVRVGKRSGKDCFAVTSFGRFFFED